MTPLPSPLEVPDPGAPAPGGRRVRWQAIRLPWRNHVTLDLYLGLRFLRLVIANGFVFSLIFVLVDSLAQFDSFSEHARGMAEFFEIAVAYYAYQLPGLYCRVLGPAITMASAMFTVSVTGHSNEFVPILGSGISLRRALLPLLLIALGLVGMTFWTQEVWIPQNRAAIRSAAGFGRGQGGVRHALFSDRRTGFLLAARRYLPSEESALGVMVRIRENRRERLITAARAVWVWGPEELGHWRLEDGEEQILENGLIVPQPMETDRENPGGSDGPKTPATRLSRPFDSLVLEKTTMIPQDLEGLESQATYLSLDELRRKASTSEESHRWLMRRYARLAGPWNHIVLLILGVGTLRRLGTSNVFLGVLMAVALAVAYFALDAAALYLGNRQTLPPAVAGCVVPMAFASLGTVLWFGMRT